MLSVQFQLVCRVAHSRACTCMPASHAMLCCAFASYDMLTKHYEHKKNMHHQMAALLTLSSTQPSHACYRVKHVA